MYALRADFHGQIQAPPGKRFTAQSLPPKKHIFPTGALQAGKRFTAQSLPPQKHISPTGALRESIAQRLTELCRDADDEGQPISSASLNQCKDFFSTHRDASLPKLTLSPDGTVCARWIHGPRNFIDIEFTGKRLVRIIAEVPRGEGHFSKLFSSELLERLPSLLTATGSSLKHA